jgi:hypothetical protein
MGPVVSAGQSSLGPARENGVSPASLTAAVTEANTFYTEGNTLATEIASLPSTDYADTALDNALSTIDQWILPDQIQLIADLAYAF